MFIHILAVHVLTVVCAYMDATLLSVYRKLSSYNTRNGVSVKKKVLQTFLGEHASIRHNTLQYPPCLVPLWIITIPS